MNANVGIGGRGGEGSKDHIIERDLWLGKKRFYSINLILPAKGTYSKRSACEEWLPLLF